MSEDEQMRKLRSFEDVAAEASHEEDPMEILEKWARMTSRGYAVPSWLMPPPTWVAPPVAGTFTHAITHTAVPEPPKTSRTRMASLAGTEFSALLVDEMHRRFGAGSREFSVSDPDPTDEPVPPEDLHIPPRNRAERRGRPAKTAPNPEVIQPEKRRRFWNRKSR